MATAVSTTVTAYKYAKNAYDFLRWLYEKATNINMTIEWKDGGDSMVITSHENGFGFLTGRVAPVYAWETRRNEEPSIFKIIEIVDSSHKFFDNFHQNFHGAKKVSQKKLLRYLTTLERGYDITTKNDLLEEYQRMYCPDIPEAMPENVTFQEWRLTIWISDKKRH